MMKLKRQITNYWSQRVEGFSSLRRREPSSEKSRLWRLELERYLPTSGTLKILDVGTGTGFLACLLAEKGHQVTGIDLTPDMITAAKATATCLSIPADFLVMDAEEPAFAPRSFDAIVTRNLTWTLPHLEAAYARWHTLLKLGGVLINFDGDYCREKVPDVLPPNHAHQGIGAKLMLEYESMKDILRPTQQPRPQWDIMLLKRAGFHNIQVDQSIWKRVYGQADEFYNPTPIFTISAIA